jgi:small nuclear ribonucleoprotein (snRNP)-like protein
MATARRTRRSISSEILDCRDKEVVLDTDSALIYIGRLVSATGHFIVLADADVHDRKESSSMNEKYLLDSKRYGIRSNRKSVYIRLERVVSYSLLEDVMDY